MNVYLNQVLKAFSEMDASQLGELLNSQYTYQEVTLDIFTQRLHDLFEEFQADGDQMLEVLPGNCCNLSCNPEYIRTAYRFVGNQTRNYLDFRFILDITDDRKDYNILDIFHCNSLQCQEKKDWFGDPKFLRIYGNEKVNFEINPDQILHSELSLKAIKELPLPPDFLSYEELNAWLMKYLPTFDFFENSLDHFPFYDLMSYDEFNRAYENLKGFFNCFDKLEIAGYLESGFSTELLDEKSLIQLVCEIEEIFCDERCDEILNEFEQQSDSSLTIQNFKLDGEGFSKLKNLITWFIPIQKRLVQKYYALTDSETDRFIESDDFMEPEASLKLLFFHMDIRKSAKERGEYIPIRITNTDQKSI